MPKVKTQPCPACGGEMRFEKRTDTLLYKGQERPIQTQAWWCKSCGEAILAGEALRARELEFQKLKAEVDQVLAPGEVAAVRSRLGLSPAPNQDVPRHNRRNCIQRDLCDFAWYRLGCLMPQTAHSARHRPVAWHSLFSRQKSQ